MTLRKLIWSITTRNLLFLAPPLIKLVILHGTMTYVLR